jgi:PPIC-type PPIASE domain
MSKLFAEPLLQFAIAGVCLYALLQFFASPGALDNRSSEIIVSQDALLSYSQYQAKSFTSGDAVKRLEQLDQAERETLINDFIRDEALYREALNLGLDRNDEILRRRLIQKMEYVAQGFYNEVPSLSEAQLNAFFQQNKQDYAIAANATFTHVFVNHTGEKSNPQARADKLLNKLNQDKVGFDGAGHLGERFLYHRNYIERDKDDINSHFGKRFSQDLFQLTVSEQWQGPIASEHGWHLLLINNLSAARSASLTEVAGVVLADAQRQQQQQLLRQAVEKIVSKYSVQRASLNL